MVCMKIARKEYKLTCRTPEKAPDSDFGNARVQLVKGLHQESQHKLVFGSTCLLEYPCPANGKILVGR